MALSAPADGKRWVLCRPQGGLNDTLCQIEWCCRYGDAFGRDVIVEIDFDDALTFRDDFSAYFDSTQPTVHASAAPFVHWFDEVDVEPAFLKGRVRRNATRSRRDSSYLHDVETGLPVTFDPQIDHAAPLLVHVALGGGDASLGVFDRFRLGDRLLGELETRMSRLGSDYVGVHVRHTDYSTDYRRGLEAIRAQLTGQVFVASDNQEVVDHFVAELGAERVVSFSDLSPNDDGWALHFHHDISRARMRNTDAILDLFTLALSRVFVMFTLLPNREGVTYSGFSRLAKNLRGAGVLERQLGGRSAVIDGVLARLPPEART